jgi:hypothetical protein
MLYKEYARGEHFVTLRERKQTFYAAIAVTPRGLEVPVLFTSHWTLNAAFAALID